MEELKNSLAKQLYFYRQVFSFMYEPYLQITRWITKYMYFLLYRDSVEGQRPQTILLMNEKTWSMKANMV